MAHINTFNYGVYNEEQAQETPFSTVNQYIEPTNESGVRKQFSYPLNELKDYVNETLVEKINEIDDTQGQIQTNYALKSESGKTLTISYSALNNNTITYGLLASDGVTLLASGTISLNLGKYITGISYDAPNKRLVVTSITNGASSTEYVSLSAILTGYATEVWCNGKFETIANCNSIRDRITVLETFKNTTVPSTYETIINCTLIRNRVADLEFFKNTTVPSTYETKSDANTHKNNTGIHTNATEKAYWNAKQKPLVAGAFIIIEDLPNGTQRISASNGEISVDYNNATNKPRINNVELQGNKTLDDFGIAPLTVVDGAVCLTFTE